MKTLSQTLAEHLTGARFDDLPADAVDAAKKSLFDALCVSLGASGLEPSCAPFIDLALKAGRAAESSIFGYGRDARVPSFLAALANGAMAHALDFEDAYDGAPLHPNASLVPAVLALAQAKGGVSGRELLTAIAVGCDLACRLALSARTPMEAGGWYPPPIFGAFGATAGAARMAGLDAGGMLNALSLTLNQSSCAGEIKENPQSTIRAVREAFPAQTAVQSALLAAAGVDAYLQPFEGRRGFFRLFLNNDVDQSVLLDDLGRRFYGGDVSYKAWPCCRGTHAFIEMALGLRAEGVRPDDIRAILFRGAPLLEMLALPHEAKCAPTTAIDAKFSLAFTTATAFVRGAVGLGDFTEGALGDPDVLALAARTRFETIPGLGHDHASSGWMTVTLTSGEEIERHVSSPLGGPENPLSWDGLVRKGAGCAAHARTPLDAAVIGQLATLIQTLETADDAAYAIFELLEL